MHLVHTSYYSHNPDVGPIGNPGSLVVTITSGKASGQLLHVAKGKATLLETFDFDAAKHTLLSSTPVIGWGSSDSKDDVDVSFVQDADPGFKGKGVEVKLGKVVNVSRAGSQSILENANVLYRIQRTNLEQDRWRIPQEATLQTLVDTSKDLDCEYIVLDVRERRPN